MDFPPKALCSVKVNHRDSDVNQTSDHVPHMRWTVPAVLQRLRLAAAACDLCCLLGLEYVASFPADPNLATSFCRI